MGKKFLNWSYALIFRHLNSLLYLSENLNKSILHPVDVSKHCWSIDLSLNCLPGLSVQILNMVFHILTEDIQSRLDACATFITINVLKFQTLYSKLFGSKVCFLCIFFLKILSGMENSEDADQTVLVWDSLKDWYMYLTSLNKLVVTCQNRICPKFWRSIFLQSVDVQNVSKIFWMNGKQWRPWSYTTFSNVSSGSVSSGLSVWILRVNMESQSLQELFSSSTAPCGSSKKCAFQYAQNAQIQIALRMRKVSSGPFIATDRALFWFEKCWYLSYFSTKTYVVGTH